MEERRRKPTPPHSRRPQFPQSGDGGRHSVLQCQRRQLQQGVPGRRGRLGHKAMQQQQQQQPARRRRRRRRRRREGLLPAAPPVYKHLHSGSRAWRWSRHWHARRRGCWWWCGSRVVAIIIRGDPGHTAREPPAPAPAPACGTDCGGCVWWRAPRERRTHGRDRVSASISSALECHHSRRRLDHDDGDCCRWRQWVCQC